MKKFYIYFLLIVSSFGYNFNNRLVYSDEKIYFSVKLLSGDIVTLAGDGKYVVYRYGNDKELKMEYPEAEVDWYKAFSISKLNEEGFESYYVNFETEMYIYRIFQEKVEDELSTGIVVKNKLTNQTMEFISLPEHLIGSLKIIYDKKLVKRVDI